ncbi:SWIB/MDM2 domain [Macleaya cordata]|uniref:SWIB/MDM2 domain n=1 Tax=Macleaya cordata TaxID=56857 RepID=A0A200QRI5_MACCD|nr:SWIB/MDM2 domain [Macleaya cordata]
MSCSRVFRGCRVLMAAAKATATKPSSTTTTSSLNPSAAAAPPAPKQSRPTALTLALLLLLLPPNSLVPLVFSRLRLSWSRVFRGCRVLMAAAKATATKPSSTTTTSSLNPSAAAAPPAPKQSRPTGILKVTPVSPALRKFLGVPEVSRTDAVKKIWEYIKSNNLQNPANKREICCDEKLKSIFEGKDKVGFLEIARLLSRHFVKTG